MRMKRIASSCMLAIATMVPLAASGAAASPAMADSTRVTASCTQGPVGGVKTDGTNIVYANMVLYCMPYRGNEAYLPTITYRANPNESWRNVTTSREFTKRSGGGVVEMDLYSYPSAAPGYYRVTYWLPGAFGGAPVQMNATKYLWG